MDVSVKMGDLMAAMPGARRAIFAKYHLGGCQSCAFSDEESLADLCGRAELDAEEVLEFLKESHKHDAEMLMEPGEVHGREGVRLIDVRTREEHEAVAIPGSEFSTQELQGKIFAEKAEETIVLYDHTGKYVLDQVAWFRGHGVEKVYGLRGGIDAWSVEVDPKVLRYRVEV